MHARLFVRFIVVAIPALLGCGRNGTLAPTSTEFSLEQAADSIPLPFGAEVKVGGVLLVLSDVPSDSRCAAGVTCVWAGDAVASIVVHPGCLHQGCRAPSMQLALHTNLEPRSGEALGHTVHLVALLPTPEAGKPTRLSRYVAWVRVTQ